MKRLLYNNLVHGFIIVVTLVVLLVVAYDYRVMSDPRGLEVIDMVTESDSIHYTLNAAVMKVSISLPTEINISIGDYIPVVDKMLPVMRRGYIILAAMTIIMLTFLLWEVLMIGDRIRKHSAKRLGITSIGEVIEYNHYAGPFYIMVVEANGTKYRYRYPFTKKEIQKFPIGSTVITYLGGKNNTWIDLSKLRLPC